VTTPGPADDIPTKVVPYVVTGYAVDEEGEGAEDVDGELPEQEGTIAPRWRAALGIGALVLAAATAALTASAIVVASANDYPAGIMLGYAAIAVSALAVVAGGLAAILARGGRFGVAAIVLAIVANPFVLLVALRFFGGFQTP
jgi:hypothetical protein